MNVYIFFPNTKVFLCERHRTSNFTAGKYREWYQSMVSATTPGRAQETLDDMKREANSPNASEKCKKSWNKFTRCLFGEENNAYTVEVGNKQKRSKKRRKVEAVVKGKAHISLPMSFPAEAFSEAKEAGHRCGLRDQTASQLAEVHV